MTKNRAIFLAVLTALFLALPQPASAYVGPGTGITVIGGALAFIGSILLAIVGFIWYPVKRLWRALMSRRAKPTNSAADSPSS